MSTAILAPTNQSEIIVRALNARSEELSSEVAQFFLSLQLAPSDVRRANELAEKSRQEHCPLPKSTTWTSTAPHWSSARYRPATQRR